MTAFPRGALKLGKKTPRVDARTPSFSRYLKVEALPALPAHVDWAQGITDWRMFKNDAYGDCTAAGIAHAVMIWAQHMDPPLRAVITDEDVIAFYEAVTDYEGARFSPGPPPVNDNGCNELDVLHCAVRNGLAGHKIDAFSVIDPKNHEHIKAAIALFGVAYVGVALPETAQAPGVWDVVDPSLNGASAPNSWGGHCVIYTAYDDAGLTCITWGAPQKLTWAWHDAYCDEAYAPLSPDWVAGTNGGIAPNHFDMPQLLADLAALQN